jgi:hypothetical protein
MTEKIGELSDSLGSKMLEFTKSMPEFAGWDIGIEPSEMDEEAKLTEKLREFAKNPRNYSILNEVINKTYLPPEAVDQLIENVEELKLAIQHGSLHINGLHRHVVTRSSDVLPDSVMWLCEHHKSMLEKFNSCEISEKQLLDHLDAATAPTQSSTATASPRCRAIQGVYVKSKSHSFPAFTKTTRSVCIVQQAAAALLRMMGVT